MFDALQTAQGKPGSPLRLLMIGTLAPARGGWWHQAIEKGTHGTTYVQSLKGDPKRWDDLRHIYAVNPLTKVSPSFRAKLRQERDEALSDSRLKARFLSYRMNLPTPDEADILLTPEDWQRVTKREVLPREGQPVVGVDLGANRAWSAAVAIWRNGRTEAVAVAPGIPDLRAQEKRDRVPGGSYSRIQETGLLRQAGGLRVVPPKMLMEWIVERWGTPQMIVSDFFRKDEMKDASPPCPVELRRTMWSYSAHDIRALRKLARDAGMNIPKEAAPLIGGSIAVAKVENDTSGNHRLVKAGTNNTGRDDVAAALVLASGAIARHKPAQAARIRIVG